MKPALSPPTHHGTPTITVLLVIMVPGVVAAVALRPGRGRGGGRSGRS
ncbi:hypothetical protein [Kitasatospora sp. NPDC018619]